MKLKPFIEQLQQLYSACGCSTRLQEDAEIDFYLETPNGEFKHLILSEEDAIEVDRNMGCGCWIGVTISLTANKLPDSTKSNQ